MKASHDSPDLLILDHAPWVLAGVLVAMILLVAALAMSLIVGGETKGILLALVGVPFLGVFLIALVRRVQLVLDRRAGTATIRRRGLIRASGEQVALSRLRRAVVETSRDDGGDTHRPALVVDGRAEALPILLVYTSGRGAERDVQRINDWLAASRALDNAASAP